MKAVIQSARVRVSLFVAAIALSALPTKSFGLAVTNDSYALPSALSNDVVRISTISAIGPNFSSGQGSGTIISTAPDGNGGTWYNVLTADHVLYSAYNAGTNSPDNLMIVSIGFLNNTSLPVSTTNVKNIALDGATNGPDLALFAVDVTAAEQAQADVIAPSKLVTNSFAAPINTAGNVIVQAGYGNKAIAGNGPPSAAGVNRYKTVMGSGLTNYDAGANSIPTNGAAVGGLVANYAGVANSRGGTYTFNAIQGSFALTTNNSGTVSSGTTYIESGDSGGPTFQPDGSGGYNLIGVHADASSHTSFTTNMDSTITTQNWANAGVDRWSDVQVSSYTPWITAEIPLIDVPEPSSLLMTGTGLLLLGVTYVRTKGRRRTGAEKRS